MINRPTYINELLKFKDKDLIKIITGIRRCGKSTIMDMYKDYLIKNGIKKDNVISINLEDLKYHFIKDYMDLYNYIINQIEDNKKYYIFIDEVQIIKDFQKVIDSLYLNKNIDIYITGSNAYLLSSELSTLLAGRYIEIKMLPLSFQEYVSAFDNQNLDDLYQQYISHGAFPYTTNLSEDIIANYISNLYNNIILKDIMLRKNINDESMLKSIVEYSLDTIGNLLSTNNIANTMTSNGRKINVRTVEKYLDSLVESYFLYKVKRYDIKGKQYLKTGEKYYISDLGMRYFILGKKFGDRGHILENVVYLELIRRGYDVYIGKIDDLEVDFLAINSYERIYIQVCETLKDNNGDIIKRELNSLNKINDNHKKMILTSDKINTYNEEGIIIKNVLNWLLENETNKNT